MYQEKIVRRIAARNIHWYSTGEGDEYLHSVANLTDDKNEGWNALPWK